MTSKTPTKKPCACASFEVDDQGTGCTDTTARQFAVGHDAKLKSLLIRAGIEGKTVRHGGNSLDPVKAAAQFGFAALVQAGIDRGRAKAARAAAKTPQPEPEPEQPRKPTRRTRRAAS